MSRFADVVAVAFATVCTGVLLSILGTRGIELAAGRNEVAAGPAAMVGARPQGALSELVRLDVVGQFGGASLNTYWADERLAYVAYGARLAVVDVSDPARPAELGGSGVLSSAPTILEAVDDIVFAASERGLLVIDVSDPARPRETGAVALSGSPAALAVLGDTAFLASRAAGLHAVQVPKSGPPRRIATLLGDTGAYGVAATTRHVYVTDLDGRLRVLRLDGQGDPVEVAPGAFADVGPVGPLAADGDLVYAVTQEGLLVLTVSEADIASVLGRHSVWEETGPFAHLEGPQAIAVGGGHAYLVDDALGLQVLDVRDPYEMVRVGAWPLAGYVLARDRMLRAVGSRLYVRNYGEVEIVDTARIAEGIHELHAWRPEGGFFPTDLAGVHGMVALQAPNLWIAQGLVYHFDLTVPERPVRSEWPADPNRCRAELIALENELAYVYDDCGVLTVFDAANPAQPTRLGSVRTDPEPGHVPEPTAIQVVDGFVYIDGCPMALVDARIPTRPQVVPSPSLADYCADRWRIDGGRLYLYDHRVGLVALDIEDPAEPRPLGRLSLDTGPNDVDASEGMVFLAEDQAVRIVDARDPSAMHVAGSRPVGGQVVRAHGGRLYLLRDMLLTVVDASPSASTEVLGRAAILNEWPYDIAVADGTAAAAFMFGLHVLDVASPGGGPQTTGALRTESAALPYASAVHGQDLYAAENAAVAAYDVSDRFAPRASARLQIPGAATREIVVDADRAYVTGSDDVSGGLHIADLRAGSAPVLLASHPISRAIDVIVRDGTAYVCRADPRSGTEYELTVVDVSEPRSPVSRGHASGPPSDHGASSACSVAVHGDTVYVYHPSSGPPADPALPPGPPSAEARIAVVDVSDPSTPSEVSSLDVGALPFSYWWTGAHWLAAHRGVLFVAGLDEGLLTYDLTNPEQPVRTSTASLPAPVYALRVHDGHVYVLTEDGIGVLAALDPTRPRLIGYAPLPSPGQDVAVAGDAIYVAAGKAGHYVLRATGGPIRSRLSLPTASR